MKKWMLLLAAILPITLLAGCAGGPAAPEESQKPPPATPSPTAAATPVPTPAATPVPADTALDGGEATGELAYGRRTYEYAGQQVSRLFYYYIPSTYRTGDKLPVMLSLHGSGSSAKLQLQDSDWQAYAEQEGILVIAPEAVAVHADGTLSSEGKALYEIGQSDPSYLRWNAVSSTDPCAQYGVDDVGYLCDLIDLFVEAGYADPARVCASGLSHGAFMSLRLAIEAPEKVAGVGVVAGLLATEYAERALSRQTKLVFIQGTADPIVPIGGMHYDFDGDGKKEFTWAYSLEDSIAWFLERCGMENAPAVSALPDLDPEDGTSIERRGYADADGTERIVSYIVTGGGHTWPGGKLYMNPALFGPVSRDARATELIWAELKDAVRETETK